MSLRNIQPARLRKTSHAIHWRKIRAQDPDKADKALRAINQAKTKERQNERQKFIIVRKDDGKLYYKSTTQVTKLDYGKYLCGDCGGSSHQYLSVRGAASLRTHITLVCM